MGYFSYICPCCNENIREGELAMTAGTYDGFGTVAEDAAPLWYHQRCIEKLLWKPLKDLGRVKSDPDQGCGQPRTQHV